MTLDEFFGELTDAAKGHRKNFVRIGDSGESMPTTTGIRLEHPRQPKYSVMLECCPIEFLALHKFPTLQTVYHIDAAEMLGLSDDDATAIVEAADNIPHRRRPDETCRRLLDALGAQVGEWE